MERLSGLDSAFLSFETPAMHLHVAMTAVIDPRTMAEPYDVAAFERFVGERLLQVPSLRRLVVDAPLRLNHPVWVEDPNIDPGAHIQRHVLPPPGGARELGELTASIVGVPLDRSRPLWEVHVVEGLADGNVAIIGKVHHCAVDGVSGAELFVNLFDLEPQPTAPRDMIGPVPDPVGQPGPPGQQVPSQVETVGHALLSQVRRTLALPALVGRTARTVGELVLRHRDPAVIAGAVPLRAPRAPWNAAITPRRAVAFARVSLDEVKQVKNAFGITINDVVLAVVGGAVRRYLMDRERLPDEPLVGMCPVSVRPEDEAGRPGNRISAMFVHLRTDIADAAMRLRAIAAATRGAKDDHDAIGARFLQRWAEHAAPATFARAARLYSRLNLADRHPPVHNLIVSNVPGPPFPLYLAGARLVATYPMGPVMEGAGLNVTVLSYLDQIDFGFLACADLVPDVWDMVDHIDGAMAELREAATSVTPPA
ncbi:MAG TPA: wax ester/triacylglycerol synthase family O-acyltransferase [Acidimicrobiales bacterium]